VPGRVSAPAPLIHAPRSRRLQGAAEEFHLAAAVQNLRRLARLTVCGLSGQAGTAAFGQGQVAMAAAAKPSRKTGLDHRAQPHSIPFRLFQQHQMFADRVVNQRRCGTQGNSDFSTQCVADQRRNPLLTHTQAHGLARDMRTLTHWLRHDVLALAGPALATRQLLFDFIVEELAAREPEDPRRIRPVRVALQNQRDDLLAFAGVLDAKLADIAQAHAIGEPLVRETLVLHRLPTTSPVYWQGWNRLRARVGGKFHALFGAVSRAMADTPRSSSLVENLKSRLRTYFTLRRHLGGSYLDLLRFFLNHRRFLRSRHAEHQGKSPRELMTGHGHPHWLTLLGLGPLQPQRA
jgi:hypothetical protein